jgi:hypothetical protein
MGLWQMLPGANISRIIARSGADWVMVDCEHGNMDGTQTSPRGHCPLLSPCGDALSMYLLGKLTRTLQMLPCMRQSLPSRLWASRLLSACRTCSHGW